MLASHSESPPGCCSDQGPQRVKLVIDTDPGVDDAMAILSAFNWEEVEVIGITTLFGNVPTAMATRNAIVIRELAAAHDPAKNDIPVVQGSLVSFSGLEKHRIADFVHGKDGFGEQNFPEPLGLAAAGAAADFIVDTVRAHPGQVIVLALAALTNVALALQKDPSIAQLWRKLVVLGGAYQAAGNVNPAAEANVFGDPEAADYVLQRTHGPSTFLLGLDVTHQCILTAAQLSSLAGQGRFGTTISLMSKFYLDYHRDAYGCDGVHVHDPTAMIACARPHLFTWHAGAVVVCTEGPLRGKTLLDVTSKHWVGENEWMKRPKVNVALKVDASAITGLCMDLMTR